MNQLVTQKNFGTRSRIAESVVALLLVLSMVLVFHPFLRADDDRNDTSIDADLLAGNLDQGSEENLPDSYSWNWADQTRTYMTKLDDGTLMVFYLERENDNAYHIVYLDSSFHVRKTRTIGCELPLFGGFYADQNGYYVVSGQKNDGESNSLEVYRVTKYDANWKKLGSCGINNCGTSSPFEAGCTRLASNGNTLYIRTTRQLYRTSDGLRHQMNYSIVVDSYNMKVKYHGTLDWNSHCFNNFVLFDGKKSVAIAHGDAYPRTISMTCGELDTSKGKQLQLTQKDLYKISGRTGDNYTGMTLDGLEVSDSSYLVFASTINQSAFESSKTKKPLMIVVDRSSMAVSTKWVADYAEGSESATNLFLVKISNTKFLTLWSRSGKVYYKFVDGKGNVTSNVFTAGGALSDCQPILDGDRVVWYVQDSVIPAVYSIDLKTNKLSFSPAGYRKVSFEDFVERLYTVALNRKSEPDGKKFWVNKVVKEGATGAECARFFLLGAPEFMNRHLSNEDFVETLYKTFFNRASDAAGKKVWVDALKNGKMSRAAVVNNFINSAEWCDVCAAYGVKSGAEFYKATKPSENAVNFAARLYTCCLGRNPEITGLKYWSRALTNLEKTGAQAAQNFFESEEFIGFKTSDKEFVTRLYTTFMGRAPEQGGMDYWLKEMKNGKPRRAVMAWFASSPEFTDICKKYGIDRGTIS